MPDHWNQLASQLGTPSIEPRAKSTTSNPAKPEVTPSPNLKQDLESSPKDESQGASASAETTKSAKPVKKSSWDSVVEFFGLGSRTTSGSSAEAEASLESSTEARAPTKVEHTSSALKPVRDKSIKKTRPSMWGDDSSAAAPAINKDEFVAEPSVIKPQDDELPEVVDPKSVSLTERSGPRRRPKRGGERQRLQLRDNDGDSDNIYPEVPAKPEIFESAELTDDDRDSSMQVPTKSSSEGTDNSSRRRHRRRRGGTRSREEDREKIPTPALTNAEDVDNEFEGEKRDEDRLQRAIRVKVPTWEEAMSSLIEANISNHQKTHSHARRRPPSGR